MKAGVGIFRGFGTAGGWQPQPHSAHAERAPNIASASPKRWISRTYITYGCMRSGCARGSTVAALRAQHVFPTQLSQGRTIPQTKTCQNRTYSCVWFVDLVHRKVGCFALLSSTMYLTPHTQPSTSIRNGDASAGGRVGKQNPTRGPEDVKKQRKHKPKIAAPAEQHRAPASL